MRSRAGSTPLLVLVVLLVVLVAGCAVPREGRAMAAASATAGLDPTFVRGALGDDDDRLAAATLHDLEEYWTRALPALAGGRAFRPLAGYVSVDSSDPAGSSPCAASAAEAEGNAYYCPRADVIVYDRAALLPVLRQDFGDTAVVVVLAHEFGHAVQQRLESGPGSAGPALPTILLEGQADCYGAAFLREVHDGGLPDLRTGSAGVDAAMAALVTFRDPVGTGADDDAAHGNAFDRVSSFQIGYEGGPARCAAMTVTNRLFTQRAFSSLADSETGGNLGLDALLAAVAPDLARFFGALVTARDRAWTTPALQRGPAACPGGREGAQGPTAYCPDDRTLHVDTGAALAAVHRRVGDYATATLLASREGLAALAALGRPTTGPDAGRAALCLVGAYTASVGSPGTDFSLSPGDLDEAVSLLLGDDDPVRATDGAVGDTSAYGRVADFRHGVTDGVDGCLRG